MSSRSFEICGEIGDRPCNLADVGTGHLLVGEGIVTPGCLDLSLGWTHPTHPLRPTKECRAFCLNRCVNLVGQ